MNEGEREALAHAAAGPLVAAMMPMGCLMGLVAGLFWLVMISLFLFCAWIWTLHRTDDAKAAGSSQIVDPAKGH
jgi:uncharacterized membrane protein